ncbi:hypothetical protein JOQ06_000641 [Pogonophryne albipinna]|uniref:Uncharacterized protein n=1 Tax=Pogonophryne albipinna TaxID=1090488 RepID=A0AAD6F7J7_9TELE|nr:hypothetical protein JOQ06_000641 [Pogonophryne albipinna]
MNLLAIPPCSPCSACKDTRAPSKGADVSDAGTIRPDANRDQHHCSRSAITQAINGPQLSSSSSSSSSSCLQPGCQSLELFAAAEDLDEDGAAIHGALARLRSCTQPSEDGVIVAWPSPARAD